MRYLVGFVFALATVASPLTVGAQAGQDDPLSGEPAPSPVPEVPTLQLKLDEAGVGVGLPPSRTPDGYTVEEMEPRVKRARIGYWVSASLFFAGALALAAGINADPAIIAGGSVAAAGIVGMATAGGIWAHRWRALKKLDPDKGRRRWWQRR